MKIRVSLVACFVCVVGGFTISLRAQSSSSPSLTPDQIRAALTRGYENPGREHGQAIEDLASSWFSALGQYAASQNQLRPGDQVAASGFRIVLYTPYTWIAREASTSQRRISEDEVTEDMLRPVFRVFAFPSIPPDMGPNSGWDVSPVANVLLMDAARRRVLQPESREPFDHKGSRGIVAVFPLNVLASVRDKGGEFRITVVGSGTNRKEFSVKKKHLPGLFLD
jgi:hypothetical protein